jgi:hypothetical protein
MMPDGWTAEMAIPFKSLRYPSRASSLRHRWGFQIQRDIMSKDESVVWAPISRDVAGFLRQMGVLDGMSDLSTSRNLELMPSATAIVARQIDTATAAYATTDVEEGGIGVKYGITSNLTFDATYNPDFSQIESDRQQIEVNQRFPVFYPELRPFFLEGQEIFNIPGPVTLLHTRTIIDPRYGAKLTGKIRKTTIGLIVANDEAPGKVTDANDSAFDRSAQFTVGRVRYDLYSESHIGAIFTDREFLDTYSRVGGFDSQFRIGNNQRLSVKAVGTNHRDAEGIERSGHLVDVAFTKEGRNLSYRLIHFSISPDFRTDAGFVPRVDQHLNIANVSYRWWPQTWVINWGPRAEYSRNYTYSGVLQDEMFTTGVNFQFARSIFTNVNVDRSMERYGGINFDKTRYNFGTGVNTSRRISFGGFMNTGDQVLYVENPYLGRGTTFGTFTTIRPFSRLQSELNLNSSRFVNREQGATVFDIKILRVLTTYQFTNRLLMRNILDFNSYDRTRGTNLLLTYRVNAGTAFYVGYDDRYRQGDYINAALLPTPRQQATNRSIFTKLQILFRY